MFVQKNLSVSKSDLWAFLDPINKGSSLCFEGRGWEKKSDRKGAIKLCFSCAFKSKTGLGKDLKRALWKTNKIKIDLS